MTGAVPEVGQPAPVFTARNQHGQLVSLADLRGTVVVLFFFPAAFSGTCTGELAALRDDLGRFTSVGARVLAVSCDAMFALRAFADSQHLTFGLLSDHWPHGAIARSYGVFDEERGVARRGSFVIDAEGSLTWSVLTGFGEARGMAEHLRAVSAA